MVKTLRCHQRTTGGLADASGDQQAFIERQPSEKFKQSSASQLSRDQPSVYGMTAQSSSPNTKRQDHKESIIWMGQLLEGLAK